MVSEKKKKFKKRFDDNKELEKLEKNIAPSSRNNMPSKWVELLW